MVQLLREQVAVAVQGDRRRLVAQVVLHGLDAGALADQQARAGVAKIMHSPELKEKLAATGTEPLTSTPEEFAAYIKREIAKWGDVIRKSGAKAD